MNFFVTVLVYVTFAVAYTRSDAGLSRDTYDIDGTTDRTKINADNSDTTTVTTSPDTEDKSRDFRIYDARWMKTSLKRILVPAKRPYYFARAAADDDEDSTETSAQYRRWHSAPLPSRPRIEPVARSTSMPSRTRSADTLSPSSPSSPSSPRRLSDTEYATVVRLPDKRQYKIRRYLRLDSTESRQDERYRVLEKEAERAFITRSYRFINPQFSAKYLNDMIGSVEYGFKQKHEYGVYTRRDLLADFNDKNDEEKSAICEFYVDYNFVLNKEGVKFDDQTNMEIYRAPATVQYHQDTLSRYADTVDVIMCPCIFPKHWRTTANGTPDVLGIAPLSLKRFADVYHREPNVYKYEAFAFVYRIVDFGQDYVKARVYSLSKMDLKRLDDEVEALEKEEQRQQRQTNKSKHRNAFAKIFSR